MSFPLSSGCFLFIFAECPESSKMKAGKKEKLEENVYYRK